MKKVFFGLVLTCLMPAALANSFTTANAYGVIKGKRVTAMAAEGSAALYTTPSTGQFFITQFCGLGGSGQITLTTDSALFPSPNNVIATFPTATACVTFPTPIPVPKGAGLICEVLGGGTCMLSGILAV